MNSFVKRVLFDLQKEHQERKGSAKLIGSSTTEGVDSLIFGGRRCGRRRPLQRQETRSRPETRGLAFYGFAAASTFSR